MKSLIHTKEIIKKITLSLFVIIIYQTSSCQENYLPGYIIKLNGDTIHGFIDYRNWAGTPDKIFFKEKLNDNKSNYTPMDIKSFGVLDEIYESAIVKTEISPEQTNELQFDSELHFKTDTTFLQAMIKGAKSLFYLNKLGKEQFYIKTDSSLELLIYKKYLSNSEGSYKPTDAGFTINENKKYLGQLILYLQDCPTIQSKLRNLKYKKESMESLFLSYYKCTKAAIAFRKKTEKATTEFGLLAGLSSTSLKFKRNTSDYMTDVSYNKSENFTAGLFFDLIFPRGQKKWSLYNELIFTSYKVNGHYTDYPDNYNYMVDDITFGYSYLKMNNMLRFKYPIGKTYIYLNAGISNGYAINEINYNKSETNFWGTVRVDSGKAINETRKWERGLLFGLGTKYKKFSFEIRFENGDGMSKYVTLHSIVNRYYFLLGYKF